MPEHLASIEAAEGSILKVRLLSPPAEVSRFELEVNLRIAEAETAMHSQRIEASFHALGDMNSHQD